MCRCLRGVVAAGFGLLCMTGGLATDEAVQLPGGARPAVLDMVPLPDDALRLIAFSPDGSRAATASALAEHENESVLRLYQRGSDARELRLQGVARSLLFRGDGEAVWVLVHRPAKRRPGDTHLHEVAWAVPKARRLRRLPPTATTLDHWSARESVLVASRNEIRTVLLDGLRSGPLFRIPGENLAVAVLAGSDLVLVGQRDRILLVNLADPPGPDEMPVRDRVDSPAAVVGLAAAPDGQSALVRMEDGSLHDLSVDPLRLRSRGATGLIARPAPGRVREPIQLAPLPQPEAAATSPQAGAAETEGAGAAASLAGAAVAEEVAAAGPAPPAPAPETPRAALPSATAEEMPPPAATEAAPTTPDESTPAATHQLQGRLAGPAAAQVTAVVILGPSSILREAARTRPAADGSWSVDDLPNGRYRIQLDAGGDLVLVSKPPFVVLELDTNSRETVTFEVRSAYAP